MSSDGDFDRPDPPGKPQPYPAEKARQGEIILRTQTRRVVFIAGLAGIVLLLLILSFAISW